MTSYYLPSDSKIGVGYQVHALANGMAGRGHSVTVYTGCPPCEGARYRTITVAAPRSMRTFAFAVSISRAQLAEYDVLHAHGDDYWLWRRRVPAHIRTMHGSCFAEAVRIPGAREKVRMVALALSEELSSVVADRTALGSPDTRRWMPWVSTVIPNGVDENVFRSDPTQRHPDPTILFVGTYRNRKRGQLLMDVFADVVRPAVPRARLVMVCQDAPDAPGVLRTGRVSEEQLAEWYRRAWVFCLPSTYEGFGIPYAEALASGTPVVASDNPGARYVLDHGRAGIITSDADLGAALVRVLTDPDERSRLAGRALTRSREFHLSVVLDRYESLYREVLDQPAGRPWFARAGRTSA